MINNKLWETICEYGPLLGFFVLYQFYGLNKATIFLVVATLGLNLVRIILKQKIKMVALLAAFFVGLFGGLTIYFNDPIYIKLKPTVLNLLFACTLFIGIYFKKLFLKQMLGASLQMPDHAWITLSKRYGFLFLILAGLNEWAWRVMGEAFWVSFKLFGMVGIVLVFTLAHAKFIMKHQKS